jgi:hypothetical protein
MVFNIPKVHIYILLIIILPSSFGRVGLLLLAFATGILIDNFENSVGVNAATATFVAFIKPYIANIFIQSQSLETQLRMKPTISDYGMAKLFRFVGAMLFFHFLFFYFFEAFSFSNFFYTLGKVIYSTIISFVFAIIYNILLNNK